MRVLCVPIRLIANNGDVTEMTEHAPWPERAGLWEAESHIDHDGVRYRYVGCDGETYVYRQERQRRAVTRDADLG